MNLSERLRNIIQGTNNHYILIIGMMREHLTTTPDLIDQRAKQYCRLMNLDFNEIYGRTRRRQYVQLRAVMMYVMRTELNMTYTAIGQRFKRDHATALYHCNEIATEVELYHDTRRVYNVLRHGIQIIEEEQTESLAYEDSRGVRAKTTRPTIQ